MTTPLDAEVDFVQAHREVAVALAKVSAGAPAAEEQLLDALDHYTAAGAQLLEAGLNPDAGASDAPVTRTTGTTAHG